MSALIVVDLRHWPLIPLIEQRDDRLQRSE